MDTPGTTPNDAISSRRLPYLLSKLKAPGVLQRLEQAAERARAEQWPCERFLETLLEAEVFARDASSARQRIRHAAFPALTTLEDFDWSVQPSAEKPLVLHLAQLAWIEEGGGASCGVSRGRIRGSPDARPRGRCDTAIETGGYWALGVMRMKRFIQGNRVVLGMSLLVIWFVVALEVVLVAVFADVPAAAWAGLAIPGAVALGLSIGAFLLLRHERPEAGLPRSERAPRSPDVHRVLVVANETLPAHALHDEIARRAERGRVDVLVVAPVLAGPVQHWTDEEDRERAQARERLDSTCAALGGLPVSATGEVGSDDPLRAIEDALRRFGADEIMISTHPAGRSNWLEKDVVGRAREYYDLPVTHIVVDSQTEALPAAPTGLNAEHRSR